MSRTSKVMLLSLTCLSLVGSARAHVSLLSPKGGETFYAGDTVLVSWEIVIEHDQENWDLYYSTTAGAVWEIIALDLPVEKLSYKWIVPNVETQHARVKIVQDNVNIIDPDYENECGSFTIVSTISSVADEALPAVFQLHKNFPNPFNPTTTIGYELREPANIRLSIYDVLGHTVSVLEDEKLSAGSYRVKWDGHDAAGNRVASGVYFYSLQANSFHQVRRMLFAK